ncbi:hypothetical protein KJA13_00325 [Patescibacteria group bacterium]|nr:hypothetical protein [Patescibacteria group bacterium]
MPLLVLLAIFLFGRSAEAQYGGGTGDPSDPYLIYTAEQVNAIGAEPNDWDRHFKLMADIDLSGVTGTDFNIIGYYRTWQDHKPFTGVFDGSGKIISNFSYTSTDTDYIGLFGYVMGGNAVIKDLGLIDPNIDAGTGNCVGSLVAINIGTITNCYAQGGSVSGNDEVGGLVGWNKWRTISDCYSTSYVSGNWRVGGLAGFNDCAPITNCYSTGSVSGTTDVGGLVGNNEGTITNCYSTSYVLGNRRVGGLVGENGYEGYLGSTYGTISNCYSSGSVLGDGYVGGLAGYNRSGTIINCYSTSYVSGDSYVGGLVGENFWGGEVMASFWDIETSGQTASAGTGKTTAEMQTESTFSDAGWDFLVESVNGTEDIWWILEGQDYPRLSWELIGDGS